MPALISSCDSADAVIWSTAVWGLLERALTAPRLLSPEGKPLSPAARRTLLLRTLEVIEAVRRLST